MPRHRWQRVTGGVILIRNVSRVSAVGFVTKGAAKPREPKTVTVETLGGDVVLRPMKAARQFELEGQCPTRSTGGFQEPSQWMGLILADTICGEDGSPLYTPADVAELDATVFWELWHVAAEFLGLSRKVAGKN